ncbi:MAG TPA: ATPase domain-containing protein [Candidatus Nanoarchaeia archaeon]|nr:ATPase domain-containing protein [Candidatus Nanoarchaeia archaeon]
MADNQERVPTGINGLDELLSGGYIRKSMNLLSGSPGSGKSILAMQFIVNGALKYNEPGVYISFEEDAESLKRNMKNFGWDIEQLEKEGKIAIINISPIDIEPSSGNNTDSGSSLGVKYSIVNKIKAKRIVIDSATAYSVLYTDELSKRKAHLELFRMLKEWGCTSLLIAEHDLETHASSPLDFEVDSITWMYNFKKEHLRTRAIEIIKMRGSKHSTSTSALEITEKGIAIYPGEPVFKS